MKQIAAVAKVAEAVSLAGYLHEAGELAEPITKGKYAVHLWGGAVGAGLVVSTLCDLVPVKNPKTKRALRIAGAVAGLAGGLRCGGRLRWAGIRPVPIRTRPARPASRKKTTRRRIWKRRP